MDWLNCRIKPCKRDIKTGVQIIPGVGLSPVGSTAVWAAHSELKGCLNKDEYKEEIKRIQKGRKNWRTLCISTQELLLIFLVGKKVVSNVEVILAKSRAALSAISIYELFNGANKKEHIKQREQLIKFCEIVGIDDKLHVKLLTFILC